MSTELSEKIAYIAQYVKDTHGLPLKADKLDAMFQDRGCVFYPVKMVFDADPLKEGEFAYMHQVDLDKNKGFMLYMHPWFKHRSEELPYLVAYHLAVVNFSEDVSAENAEKLGAALMEMEVDSYYDKVNTLFESIVNKPRCMA